MAIKRDGQQDMLIRMPQDSHDRLRKMSYLMNIPMTELVRRAVNIWLNETKDLLTNAKVVI